MLMINIECLAPSVKKAMDQGIFNIRQGDLSYGTMGIICHYENDGQSSEFYFNKDVFDYASAEEYVAAKGIDEICLDIANTIIKKMLLDPEFRDEGLLYINTLIPLEEDEQTKQEILSLIDIEIEEQ